MSDLQQFATTKPNVNRWKALGVVCLGVLMIMIDSTIVNVALPSIKNELFSSETSLAWVVNAYFLTYGGFLLLGGRLGDIFGHRRLFLIGIAVFTIASLGCGAAQSSIILILFRAVQGFGGAIVTAVALSLIIDLFQDQSERAKAMGAYGFVCASGSTLGAIFGGAITEWFGWHWIFLANLPLGAAVVLYSLVLLPPDHSSAGNRELDIAGAIVGTASLLLAVYTIVNGNAWGWGSSFILYGLAGAIFLLATFLFIEIRAKRPLMPLSIFALRNVASANVVAVFWAAALFAWFFLSSLHLQLVLGYDPLQVGLAFLPANAIMAIFSLTVSGKLVTNFGPRLPLILGLLIAATGLSCFSFGAIDGEYLTSVLPGMVLFGIGGGIAINPMLLAATDGVPAADSGVAGGVVNTSFAMGGSFWLALLTSLAASRTESLKVSGVADLVAQNSGYQQAFLAAAILSLIGALVSRTPPGRTV